MDFQNDTWNHHCSCREFRECHHISPVLSFTLMSVRHRLVFVSKYFMYAYQNSFLALLQTFDLSLHTFVAWALGSNVWLLSLLLLLFEIEAEYLFADFLILFLALKLQDFVASVRS